MATKNWYVERNCCNSGNCIKCMSVQGHRYGETTRVIQIDKVSEEKAKEIASNFASYKAIAKKM